MHNFTVPETLKAGVDKVASFSRTFRSTPNGQIDFPADRSTFIVIVADGSFSDDRTRQPDHLAPYLR
jgi:FMN-dependent NADH-azoreductase